jgi:hypothetical protein
VVVLNYRTYISSRISGVYVRGLLSIVSAGGTVVCFPSQPPRQLKQHTHTGTEPIEVRAVYSQTQPQADERVHSHDQRVNWVCRVQITAPQPAEPRCAAPLGRSRSAAAAAGDCTTARLTPIEQGTCARAALSGRVGTWPGSTELRKQDTRSDDAACVSVELRVNNKEHVQLGLPFHLN